MKTFKEIEAFVRKAMDKNLTMSKDVFDTIFIYNKDSIIEIRKRKNPDEETEHLRIHCYYDRNKYFGCSDAIELSLREKELYKILVLDVEEYERSRVDEMLDNFFFEENITATIDNLEFDDENHN